MKSKLLFVALLFSATAQAQLIQTTDSILYSVLNYLPLTGVQRNNNFTFSRMYRNILNPQYQMQKLSLDSAQTKPLSKTFYHNNKLDGPFEGYQMERLQVKGRYKNGKLDGERITYYNSGLVMEKAEYKNEKKAGVWEYYNIQGVLKRKITYGNNGNIIGDERF